MTLTYGALFAGYGGLEMGVQSVLGGTTSWVSEIEPASSKILAHHYPDVPNLGDVTKVDWHAVPPVDVITGGYPCQPFSAAGQRRGTDDVRHLWPYVADAIAVLRPPLCVFENVRGHLSLGFKEVVRDLHQLGYDVTWYLLRASDVGAAHGRARLFIFGRNRGKCGVCGRVDRRGGMDRHHEQIQGRDVRDQPQSLDVRHGDACAGGTRGDAGGQGDTGPGGHRHSTADLAVATDGEACGGSSAPGLTAPTGEAGAGSTGSGDDGDGRGCADGTGRGRSVVNGDVGTGGAATEPHQAPEPTRARPGPARRETAGDLPLGRVVGAGGEPLRPGGVHGTVPDVWADGGRPCLCQALVGAAHGRFRIFLFATPANADSFGCERLGMGLRPAGLQPTPRCSPPPQSDVPGQLTLLPTPSAADGMGGHMNRSGDRSVELLLPGIVRDMTQDWREYESAIRRQEAAFGRPAPPPTELGAKGQPRLSPRFVEWLMGLPEGHVTDVPGISRNDMLKALGNGVVMQQAAAATRAFVHDTRAEAVA